MSYPIIRHGSEDSLDVDAYVILPAPLEFKEAKKLCDSYKDINANLLVVSGGVVSWCYKGTKDECNNSILATYHLHEQNFPCPIEFVADRQYGLKMLRTIRGLLSYNSRTELREEIKKALTSDDLNKKLEVLNKVDLTKVADFQKTSLTEAYKFFAFQMGQTLGLLQDNVELFTKKAVGEYYPELMPYLKREPSSPNNLQQFYSSFTGFVGENFTKLKHHQLFSTNFHGKREVLDCKKEITLPRVVIFDIDGTLMDESHRKHLRESGDWDTYFSKCDLDVPIQKMVDLTKEYKSKGYEIWLMSGRSETCKDKTIQSLNEHGVCFDCINLRGSDVFVPDYVLKPAWVSKYVGIERVDAVYDDTDKVIEGFRSKGLNVFDVKEMLIHKQDSPKKMGM